MNSSIRGIRCLIGVGFFLLLAMGCGSGGTDEAAEWTVQEDALALEQDLFAGDDESYFFSSIDNLAVRADGRIYVADGTASHVKVLAPDGTLQDTLGRKGKGPGEFGDLSEVTVARGDSLYALDRDVSRISVFTPEDTFSRGFSIKAELGSSQNLLVPERRQDFAALYSSPATSEEMRLGQRAVRRIGPAGAVKDTLFTVPPRQMYMNQDGSRVGIWLLPFARSPAIAVGPEARIHYGWSDSLKVTTYNFAGDRLRTVRIPFDPVPVTDTDLERELGGMPAMAPTDAIRKEVPTTKPAFEHFLVDDEGRYWFERPTANPDSTDWWVAWPDEQRVVTTTLPSEVQLLEVTDGSAYGSTTTDAGAPVLVRYRIHIGN
jgi:hypothetical protein